MTHFKDGLAPVTPETTGGMEKRRGNGSPTPRAAGSGKSPIRAALTAREDELPQNRLLGTYHFSI